MEHYITSTIHFKFQSTLPARGATMPAAAGIPVTGYFNPRSPRGERRFSPNIFPAWHNDFNPRSPRGERHTGYRILIWPTRFQSTLPARGATGCCYPPCCGQDISIHAPREGSDALLVGRPQVFRISIHAPREGSDHPRSCPRLR